MARISGSLKYGPPSEAQIVGLESLIGASLPEDYKDFLRVHNGGHPEPDAFLFSNDFGEGEEDVVECFFPLRDADCQEVDDTVDGLPDWPVHCAWEDLQQDLRDLYECELEHQILPIGADGSGNYIAIVLDSDQAGAIVFFEHEMATVSPLAPSFASFLSGLRARQRDDYG